MKVTGFLLKASLAWGLGVAAVSIITLFWLLSLGAWSPVLNWIWLALAAGGLIALVLRLSKRNSETELPGKAGEAMSRFLIPYFYLALLLAVAFSIFHILQYPHGAWDAWSHWNLRARFIFRGGELWTNAFHPDFWNPLNYPLLVPLAVAAGWGLLGFESPWVPGGIALAFLLATVLLLLAALSRMRSPGQGLFAAIILLGTPYFLIHANSQYADIPLSFYCLASFVALSRYDLDEKRPVPYLVLAGSFAGLAAWTKNEGLLFIGCLGLVRLLSKLFREGWRQATRELMWLALGLFPVLAVVLYVKTQFYPPRSIFETRGILYSFDKFADLGRYGTIAFNFLQACFYFGRWAIVLPLPFPFFLLLYLFWVKTQPASPTRRAGTRVLWTLLLMLGGYFAVYLATPHDLQWLLGTSITRLFLCLWPAFLFGFFMVIRTPQEVAISRQAAKESLPCT